MNIQEIVTTLPSLSINEAKQVLYGLAESHPELFLSEPNPLTGKVGVVALEARLEQAMSILHQQQQLIDSDSRFRKSVAPHFLSLYASVQQFLPGVQKLLEDHQEIQRKRRQPKAGTVEMMREVHRLKETEDYKWEVIHKKLKKEWQGYKIQSAASLRLRYSRFMRDSSKKAEL